MRSGICSGPCRRRRHLVAVYLCRCSPENGKAQCVQHHIRWVVRRHTCGIGLDPREGTVLVG